MYSQKKSNIKNSLSNDDLDTGYTDNVKVFLGLIQVLVGHFAYTKKSLFTAPCPIFNKAPIYDQVPADQLSDQHEEDEQDEISPLKFNQNKLKFNQNSFRSYQSSRSSFRPNNNNSNRSNYSNLNLPRASRRITLHQSHTPQQLHDHLHQENEAYQEENEIYDDKIRKAWVLFFNPFHPNGSVWLISSIILGLITITCGILAIIFKKDLLGYLSMILLLFSFGLVLMWWTVSLEVEVLKKHTGYYTLAERPAEIGGPGKNSRPLAQGGGFKTLNVRERDEITRKIGKGEAVYKEGTGTYI